MNLCSVRYFYAPLDFLRLNKIISLLKISEGKFISNINATTYDLRYIQVLQR